MTQYVLIIDGVVVQKQPYSQDGFIEAPDDVVCGQLFDGETFSNPEPSISSQITEAPVDLFGGPTLGDIFNGN